MFNSHLPQYSGRPYDYSVDEDSTISSRQMGSYGSNSKNFAAPRAMPMIQNYSQDSNGSLSSISTQSYASYCTSPNYSPAVVDAFRCFDDELQSSGIVQRGFEADEEYSQIPQSYHQGYYSGNNVSQNQTAYENNTYNNVTMTGTVYEEEPHYANQDAPSEAPYQETSEEDYREYLSKTRSAGRCAFPKCKSKGRFKRDADLIRHFEENHKPAKKLFYCDYKNCKRHTKPIHRKSHYKEHLRNYHHEPLSTGRGEKRINTGEAPSVSTLWWRCSECLRRNNIDRDGWECANADCGTPCEASRKEMIMRKIEAKHPDCNACGGTGRNYLDDLLSCSACQHYA